MPAAPPLYHLINLWISLTRYLHQAADIGRQERYGAQVDDLLIRAAVYLGTVEGRPMTASKLATYVGIPRPTVLRRLHALERRRIVERNVRTWCTPARLVKRREQQDFGAVIRLVRSANDRLQRKQV